MLRLVIAGASIACIWGHITRATAGDAIVVLDSWWSRDYAGNVCSSARAFINENRDLINRVGCASVTSCTELMPTVNACSGNPTPDVTDFEDRLATRLAVDAKCKGIHFIRYSGPKSGSNEIVARAMQSPHWSLMIDYTPGATKQLWSLQFSDGKIFLKGNGSAEEIASQICPIALGQGASIRN